MKTPFWSKFAVRFVSVVKSCEGNKEDTKKLD